MKKPLLTFCLFFAFYRWINKNVRRAVRFESEDNGFTIEWKNWQCGSQPSSLFEISEDYVRK